MKKNIAMRVAAFLFILTMISTCAFATTFAKYTTSDNATDEARVAKFGVTVVMTDYDVFSQHYKDDALASKTGATVSASTNVVAPGTQGKLTGMSITGTPEVAVNVAFTADLVLSGWTVDGAEYCPIVITVDGKKYQIGGTALDGTTINSVAQLEAAVEAAIAKYTKNYEANKDLSTIGADAPEVSWSWAFETGSTETEKDANNIKDTKLGDSATAKISLKVTCTVTQID